LLAGTTRAQQFSFLDKARDAIDAKQYNVAEQLCRQALAQGPPSDEVLTTLGLSLHMQGRSSDAIRYYSMALKLRYVPETYALLAAEKCKMGDVDGVRPMLQKIYREERKNPRVISAQEVLKNKDYPEDLALVMLAKSYIWSEEFFTEKLSKAPGSEPFRAALRKAPSAGSSAARSAFPEAARISPYFSPDLSWPEAVARRQQHPQDAALLYLLSVLSAEGAIREIQICNERFPDSPNLQQFMADVLADQGHEDEAIEQYEQLIREHPELPDLQFSLGMVREKMGQWMEAAELFRQQLAKNPTDEQAAANLSMCMVETGQYAELRAFLQPRMRSEHPPLWASPDLAEAERKLGNTQEAIGILVRAEHQPDVDKLVHYRLMHLYSISGMSADAKREEALFQAASQH
jgi:tetratricopeptide (TPR) repeat protein